MNIHVARTPHFRTRFTHTCCQGQTGSLTVRPDTARCPDQWLSLSDQRWHLLAHDVSELSVDYFSHKDNKPLDEIRWGLR